MGRRQVVRHLVLVQAFGGSNPSAPEYKRPACRSFFVAKGFFESPSHKTILNRFVRQSAPEKTPRTFVQRCFLLQEKVRTKWVRARTS